MNFKNLALLCSSLSLLVFIFIGIVYHTHAIERESFSIFVTLIALIIATFSFTKNETFNERLDIFLTGSSQSIVVHMCYIFFLTTIFTTILEHTGSITSAVNVCLHLFPTWFMLPGIFLGACLVTFTIGSSIGAIAAFTPIAISIAHHVGINPSLMAATIICGSVFGDNLSIASETTILSVKITDTTMAKKFFMNVKIGLPAFLCTLLVLIFQNSFVPGCGHIHNLCDLNYLDLIKALPYTLTFCLALTGLDMIFVIMMGIIFAIALGIFYNNFTLATAINFMFDGFYHTKDAVYLFVLVVLLSGLLTIVTHNGGINFIIETFKKKISNTRHAKFVMFGLVVLVNAIIAINSIAILLCGPAVNQIGHECDVDPTETACILGIVSCALQGSLPYAPQLILAASIAKVSTFSLMPYLYYQFFLLISLCVTLYRNGKKCSPAACVAKKLV